MELFWDSTMHFHTADSFKIDLMPTQYIERCGRMFQFNFFEHSKTRASVNAVD